MIINKFEIYRLILYWIITIIFLQDEYSHCLETFEAVPEATDVWDLVTKTAEFPSPLVTGGGCRIPVLGLHPAAEHGATHGATHGAEHGARS